MLLRRVSLSALNISATGPRVSSRKSSVSMAPGQTAFTVIPCEAVSRASARVKPSMAAFAEQ